MSRLWKEIHAVLKRRVKKWQIDNTTQKLSLLTQQNRDNQKDNLDKNKNKPSTRSFQTNLWQLCPFLNGELSSSSNTGLATPKTEQSGLDLLPSQPPPYSPRHQATTAGNVSHPFSVNLLTVCPLPSICTSMSNSVLSLRKCSYAVTGKIIFIMQRFNGSITLWSWLVVLKTPTVMPALPGTKTTGQTEG